MSVLYTFLPQKKFLTPGKIIESFSLKSGDTIIDFGSGPGFWTIIMAEKVVPGGKVYAVDQFETNLEIIKSKAQAKGLTNIIYKKSLYSAGKISVSDKADLILISNILSLIKNDESLILSARENAKEGTKLVIVDWSKKSKLGPKEVEKSSEEEVIILAKRAGFTFKKILESGSHHFALYFEYKG